MRVCDGWSAVCSVLFVVMICLMDSVLVIWSLDVLRDIFTFSEKIT